MRIISGSARGRRLFAPEGVDTRPTTDRVRESLFNILARDIPGARVLDLFAGSGALALEAVSRGAHSAVLGDKSIKAIRCVERNVELVGCAERCRVMTGDWQATLRRIEGEAFSLVFLDPPYREVEIYAQVLNRLLENGMLLPGATIVMERLSRAALAVPEGFIIFDERRYGESTIVLVRAKETEM